MIKNFENKLANMPEFSSDHSFWLRRFQSDILELQKRENDIKKCETAYFINKLSDFCVRILINIIPKEGLFSNYEFQFKTYLKKEFPFKPLQIFTQNYVYHPNIHAETKEVFLPLLSKEMWSPNTSLYIIILSLEFMVLEPNFYLIPNTLQNIECALLYQKDSISFKRKFNQMSYNAHMLEEIEFEEKNKYLLEIELPEQIIENHNDTPRKFLYSHENIGNDLENEMNNLKINPKKRRMDDGDCEKFQIKKIH